jgi:hypothetical protein
MVLLLFDMTTQNKFGLSRHSASVYARCRWLREWAGVIYLPTDVPLLC